jgi:hypothetical protein
MLQARDFIHILEIHDFSPPANFDDNGLEDSNSGSSGADGIPGGPLASFNHPWLCVYHFTGNIDDSSQWWLLLPRGGGGACWSRVAQQLAHSMITSMCPPDRGYGGTPTQTNLHRRSKQTQQRLPQLVDCFCKKPQSWGQLATLRPPRSWSRLSSRFALPPQGRRVPRHQLASARLTEAELI